MGRRNGIESFPRYQHYLNQASVWPSESNSNEFVRIADMVPRYAISAHDKLLRWADTVIAQAALNIYDHIERERYVRNSALARALILQSQRISPDAQAEMPTEVTPRDMILAFAPIIAEHTSLDITAIFKLAEALATKADDEWTVTI